jgi:hypothetical protein
VAAGGGEQNTVRSACKAAGGVAVVEGQEWRGSGAAATAAAAAAREARCEQLRAQLACVSADAKVGPGSEIASVLRALPLLSPCLHTRWGCGL